MIRYQQTQNICKTFVQRLPNIFDVGQTLYKCYTNVLYLLEQLITFARNQIQESNINCTVCSNIFARVGPIMFYPIKPFYIRC